DLAMYPIGKHPSVTLSEAKSLRDSSVVLLPQNDRKRRAQNDREKFTGEVQLLQIFKRKLVVVLILQIAY
ncbi:MAG: hypothetical protein COS87_00850, partial [Chloroflexi bacterium CG07_land_8_20_14_0_80_45_17]